MSQRAVPDPLTWRTRETLLDKYDSIESNIQIRVAVAISSISLFLESFYYRSIGITQAVKQRLLATSCSPRLLHCEVATSQHLY